MRKEVSKLFVLLLLVQFLSIEKSGAQVLQTGYCGKDERCQRISECAEYEYVKSRNFAALKRMKICGVYIETDEYCCKRENNLEIPTTSVPPVEQSTTIPFHENMHKINHKSCGESLAFRIIGGKNAALREFPWMALLAYKDAEKANITFKCSGSLITEKHVLTAAHCLTYPSYTLVSVRLGEYRISTHIDCVAPNFNCFNSVPVIQDIEPSRFKTHEKYDSIRKVHDIALITLKTNVYFHQPPNPTNVGTICLPINEEHLVDYLKNKEKDLIMTIAGWGHTNEADKMSDVLQVATIPFLNHEDCSSRYTKLRTDYKSFTTVVEEGHLCAGGRNNVDTCKGDSGGPLMALAQNSNQDRLFLVGIVSTGIRCSYEVPQPGLYTKVSYYMTWILDNLID